MFSRDLKIAEALSGFLIVSFFLSAGPAFNGFCQSSGGDLQAKVDAVIESAYKSAAAQFPCKVKTRGKARMLRYQQVDECLNAAYNRVDWDEISGRIQELRKSGGFSWTDISLAVESSLSAHAIPYSKVFSVKDIEALLPLTNSTLKFLPAGSLQDFPVYEQSGERIGAFAGVYSYEKAGALTVGNVYRISIFQYVDLKGEMRTPSSSSRLLFDSYGVPWKGAISQPGFRLTADKLNLRR